MRICCFVRWFEVWKTSNLTWKVLIVAVRSCDCGALIRGLQNIGASCKGIRVVTFCVVQKVTKKHAGRSPATHDSKLCRKRLRRNFRRHVSKPVLSAKRRRRGFESVRKGYRTADARPLFFEKEILYCKLTVSFRRWKLRLHVSFGAVGSWSFGVLKKAFLYQVALHEPKKTLLSRTKKFFVSRKLYELHSKPLFYA